MFDRCNSNRILPTPRNSNWPAMKTFGRMMNYCNPFWKMMRSCLVMPIGSHPYLCLLLMHIHIAFEELEIADDIPEDLLEKETQGELTSSTHRRRTIQWLTLFIVTVDLSNIQPTTELEKKLLAMLQSADERYSELKSQFEDYQTMVKKTFLDNIIDDTRRYGWWSYIHGGYGGIDWSILVSVLCPLWASALALARLLRMKETIILNPMHTMVSHTTQPSLSISHTFHSFRNPRANVER